MNNVELAEKLKQEGRDEGRNEGRTEAEVIVTRDLLKELASKNDVTFDKKSLERVEKSEDARELRGLFLWVAQQRSSAVSLAK